MPEEMSSSAFNEQIRVEFDISSVDAQLEALAQKWNNALSQMGGSGTGITELLDFGALNKQFAELSTNFQGVFDSFATNVAGIQQNFQEALSVANQSIGKALAGTAKATVSAAVDEAGEEAIKRAKSIQERIEEIIRKVEGGEAGVTPPQEYEVQHPVYEFIKGKVNPNHQTPLIPGEVREQNPEYLDKLSSGMRKWYADYDAQMAAAEYKQEKSRRAAEEQEARKDQAEAERDAKRQERESQREAKLQERESQREAKRQERDSQRLRKQEEVEARRQASAEQREYKDSLFGSLTSDIPSMIGNLVKFQLIWTSINALMEAAGDIIMSPIRALQEGVEYLTELEQKAEQLTGPLALGLNFAKGFADNFKAASDIAPQLAQAFQAMSARDGLPVESLMKTSKVLLNAGIGNMIQDMGQLANLTELFTVALQASGKQATAARDIASEIPKLLSGQVTGHETILRILDVTKDEWMKIRQEALDNGNLYEQLAPRLAPLVEQITAGEKTMHGLMESSKLTFEVISGMFAEGLFEGGKQSLETILKLAQSSLDVFKDLAASISSIVSELLSVIKAAVGVHSASDLIVGTWKYLLAFISESLHLIERFVTDLTNAYKMLVGVKDLTMGVVTGNKEAIKDGAEDVAYAYNKGVKQAKVVDDRYDKTLTDIVSMDPEKASSSFVAELMKKLSSVTFDGGRSIGQVDKVDKRGPSELLARLGAENRTDIDKVRQEAQERIDVANEEYAQRKIGQQQLHDEVNKALVDEKRQVDELIAKYKDAVKGIKGLTAEQSLKAIAGANDIQIRSDRSIDHLVTQNNIKLTNEDLGNQTKLRDDGASHRIEMMRLELDLIKSLGASEEEIAIKNAALHQQEYANKLRDLELQRQEFALVPEKLAFINQEIAQVKELARAKADADTFAISRARDKDLTSEADMVFLGDRERLEAAKKEAGRPRAGQSSAEQRSRQVDYLQVANQTANAEVIIERAILQRAEAEKAGIDVIDRHKKKLKELEATAKEAAEALKEAEKHQSPGSALMGKVFGDSGVTSFKDIFKSGNSDDEGGGISGQIRSGATHLQNAFEYFDTSTNKLIDAFKNHGRLAGAGAAASSLGGVLSQFSGMAGAAGGILSLAGSVISVVSSLFEASAQRIANRINTQFNATMQAYNLGGMTMTNAIAQIKQEEQDAITQLSGKKGGQKQLNDLLPQLQSAQHQLELQQQQYVQSFNESLTQLQGGNLQPLQDMVSQWNQINQMVQNYIQSGGDAVKAQQYVSLSLAAFRTQMQQQLTSEQLQAVQDAEQLNQLLQQRIDLERNYAQQQFSAVNADALERRSSYAVTTGTQYQQQQQQYQLQLQQLNNQISLYQQKVDMEKQIFQITTDTNGAQLEANALQIQQLQTQLEIYKQQEMIVNNIVDSTTGQTGITSLLSSLLGFNVNGGSSIITPGSPITIQITLADGSDANAVGDAVYDSLVKAARYGTGTSLQTLNN